LAGISFHEVLTESWNEHIDRNQKLVDKNSSNTVSVIAPITATFYNACNGMMDEAVTFPRTPGVTIVTDYRRNNMPYIPNRIDIGGNRTRIKRS
jgi:hypothetical protein